MNRLGHDPKATSHRSAASPIQSQSQLLRQDDENGAPATTQLKGGPRSIRAFEHRCQARF